MLALGAIAALLICQPANSQTGVPPPTTHYVNINSANPAPPYTNWATAARAIQDAVDAASLDGAIVLVTNGTYASGGAVVSSLYGSNRVAVTKPLVIRSVNGPGVTVIQGDRSGTSTEVRCVYLTNGASLSGFTLTNGGAGYYTAGAGVWCSSSDAMVSNCVLVGNEADSHGSGGYGGTYQNCMFLSNSFAAAVEQAIVSNCVLDGNYGSAAYQSTLDQCVVSRNYYGAQECALDNCILSANRGGVYRGFLTNCTITGAGSGYVAASASTLVHCNVVGNSGSGVDNCQLYNSIVYYNTSGNVSPYTSSTLNFCCTTPLPTNGIGNISAEPLLADLSHISAGSPCLGAGNAAYTSGMDIDGEAWLDPPSIGCDEYRAGAITGSLNLSISAPATNVVSGFRLGLTSQISGHASSNQWDFADGTTSANRQFESHAWNTAGDYLVKFHAYNESNPGGVTATLMIHVDALSQDWQTVDDFVLGSGNASANGIATDAIGGVYVVGTASGHGIVRYSPDGGSNWITRDDFVYPSAAYYWDTNNEFNAVTVDNQGTVFVGGSGDGHWIVRRSTDHGITWETVDDYWRAANPPNEPGTNGIVYSLCTDGQGRVYGAGPLIKTYCPCYSTWWVRGSSIGGTNWDTKLVLPSGYGGIKQATCAGEDVYVTGAADGMPLIGLVVRSSDHGATWTPIFDAIGDIHDAITADSAGNLYSAGYGGVSTFFVWLVRRLAPGGTNWITLDSSSYEPWRDGLSVPGGYYPYPTSIAVDAAGNVCVVGQLVGNVVTTDSGGATYIQNWFTRQYSVATAQWSTTDLFSYSTNEPAIALGTTFTPSGSVFVVGYGTSDTGQQRWVVRKRAAPSPAALARALQNEVTDLIGRSAIARERARVLLSILDRMVAEMDQGQSALACNTASTFSNKVQQFVEQGILAQSDAASLINGIVSLSLMLGCQERQK